MATNIIVLADKILTAAMMLFKSYQELTGKSDDEVMDMIKPESAKSDELLKKLNDT